jgi:hypothetical protein
MAQKELRKLSQWLWKGFLKWYDGGGENGITSKRIFEVEVSFSSPNVNFPLYLMRLLEGFFFFLSFFAPSLDDIWGENHLFKNFFSNGFNILAVDAYSEVELCTPTW